MKYRADSSFSADSLVSMSKFAREEGHFDIAHSLESQAIAAWRRNRRAQCAALKLADPRPRAVRMVESQSLSANP